MKKLVITETQFKALNEKWKKDIETAKQIAEDIDFLSKKLNESALINEGVLDVIKNYLRKGALTATVLASLFASQHVNAQQAQEAGVPPATIERAMEIMKSGGGGVPLNQIEAKLIQTMKRHGMDQGIQIFKSLPANQKQNLLNGIQKQIKSLNDLDNKYPVIFQQMSRFTGKDLGANKFMIDAQKGGQEIIATISEVRASLPLGQHFAPNSAELQNIEETKKKLLDSLNTFVQIDSIVIKASSSTLRNTGEFEGMTWIESSTARANAIKALLEGATYDVGGQGRNKKYQITADQIKIDVNGSNGDGTSGPKSPYEVDPQMQQAYQQRGIDAKYWQSQATEAPIEKSQYNQFQYVTVIIYGKMVSDVTQDIVNIKVATLREFGDGEIKVIKPKYEKLKLNKCAVQ